MEPYTTVIRLNPHHQSSGDIHPAYVKAELARRGITLTALAHRNGKEASYFRAALKKPFPRAMRIVAKALARRPHELWPSLFDEDNQPIKRLPVAKSRGRSSTNGGKKHIRGGLVRP